MKASLIAFGCVLLGVSACTAPQGKKLASNSGLAPVATGPVGPATKSAVLTGARSGEMVSLIKGGTVTVTLDAADSDGYSWRLSEIPDPTVLKLVSQEFIPSATPGGKGQEKLVFQSTGGTGDVDVRMWYGDMRNSPLSGNPTFDFITAVSDQPTAPAKSHSKSKKKTLTSPSA
jgi:predicted secreted protein